MDGPHIRVEETGEIHPLTAEVTTVGRGRGVDIILSDPSVSQLHAEIEYRYSVWPLPTTWVVGFTGDKVVDKSEQRR